MGNSSGATAIDFCWKAIGRWTYFVGLQYSKRVHFAFGFAIERRKLKEYPALSLFMQIIKNSNNSDSIHIFLFFTFFLLLDLKSIFSFILFVFAIRVFFFPFFAYNLR